MTATASESEAAPHNNIPSRAAHAISRLGILIPEFPSQTHAFFWREICALRESGIEVHLISTRRPATKCPHPFADEAQAETHYVYPPRLLPALATFLRHPIGFLRCLGYILGLRESKIKGRLRAAGYALCAADLAGHCRRHSIEHIHAHSCAEAAHVAAICLLLGGPSYSLHLHGDLPVYGVDHKSKMKRASFVSADARPMQRQAIDIVGIPESRTHTIWMGVDTSKFTPADKPASSVARHFGAQALTPSPGTPGEGGGEGAFSSIPGEMRPHPNPLPEYQERGERGAEAAGQDDELHSPVSGALRIITIARLHRCKGHVHALAAVRAALDAGAQIKYSIAGTGPDEQLIREKIAELKLGEHVKLLGSIGETHVLSLLRASDVFLLSSVGMGEASPVAVMEAMSCGLPIIASIIGGTPDMIRDGVDGFLLPQQDEKGLTDAIVRLAREEQLRQRMGLAARARAVETFDVRRVAEKLLAAIDAAREEH